MYGCTVSDDKMQSIRGAVEGYVPPRPVAPLCRRCGKLIEDMAQLEHPEDAYHDRCHPSKVIFAGNTKILGTDHPLRNDLVRVIRTKLDHHERNHQVAIGPSEVGQPCTRRLAYGVAAIPEVNHVADPWPAGVGTMIHSFIAEALAEEDARRQRKRWIIEQSVTPDPVIRGTSDCYDTETCTVVDHKTIGKPTSEVTKKLQDGKLGVYYAQGQTYGLGWLRSGYVVKKVGLFFLPRAGMLRDAAYIEWDFNPAFAQSVIDRLYSVARQTKTMLDQSACDGVDRWSTVPCDTEGYCGWCPWYDRRAGKATVSGCPAR